MTRLESLPPTFLATREALHRVAEQVVAPARKPDNEIALRRTPGGFGTPPFEFDGATRQVRVDGAELVVATDGEERRVALTSLAQAAGFAGSGLFTAGAPDDDSPLGLDPVAAARLGDFYAVADEALERFRGGLAAADEPSEVNLWPEHFDLAIEAGAEAAGARANYGASPGDEHHPEPYFYVGPWAAPPAGELWEATGFTGAELDYAELARAGDPVSAAVEFFERRHAALGD